MDQALKPLKWYKKLHTRKGRMDHGAFLVEGQRAVDQVIRNHPSEVIEIVAVGETFGEYPLTLHSRKVTPEQMSAISSTKTPQGIIAVVRLPQDIYSDAVPESIGQRILLLEDIQDPGNVGTLIRTAVAFGFDGIILSEKCADPLGPKCVQAGAGTMLSLWLRRIPHYLRLIEELQNGGFRLVTADLCGTQTPDKFLSHTKTMLALGNEAAGLSESLLRMADDSVRIPIEQEKAQSLNVAVSGAILMYLISAKG